VSGIRSWPRARWSKLREALGPPQSLRNLVMLLCLGAAAAYTPGSAFKGAVRDPRDFYTFYAAGKAVLSGRNPYRGANLLHWENLAGHAQFPLAQVYPFRDPPPVAQVFALIGHVPARAAAVLWLGLIVACACFCGVAGLSLLKRQFPLRDRIALGILIGLAFAPLRNGVVLDQLDPLFAALFIAGIYLATVGSRPLLGAAFCAVSGLKPQTTISDTATTTLGALRVRWLLGLVIGTAVVAVVWVLGEAASLKASWSSWEGALRQARTTPSSLALTVGLIEVLIAAVLIVLLWRARRSVVYGAAAGACFNAVLAPLFFLNLQSDALLVLPFILVLASPKAGRERQILAGVVGGALSLNGLFAVGYYAGLAHTFVPTVMALLLALGLLIKFPSHKLEIVAGLFTNLLLLLVATPNLDKVIAPLTSLCLLSLMLHDAATASADHVADPRFT